MAPIDEKVGESFLRWFGDVSRNAINAPVKKIEFNLREQKKIRGRPKLTLIDIVKNDMSINEVTKSMTSDRIE